MPQQVIVRSDASEVKHQVATSLRLVNIILYFVVIGVIIYVAQAVLGTAFQIIGFAALILWVLISMTSLFSFNAFKNHDLTWRQQHVETVLKLMPQRDPKEVADKFKDRHAQGALVYVVLMISVITVMVGFATNTSYQQNTYVSLLGAATIVTMVYGTLKSIIRSAYVNTHLDDKITEHMRVFYFIQRWIGVTYTAALIAVKFGLIK